MSRYFLSNQVYWTSFKATIALQQATAVLPDFYL